MLWCKGTGEVLGSSEMERLSFSDLITKELCLCQSRKWLELAIIQSWMVHVPNTTIIVYILTIEWSDQRWLMMIIFSWRISFKYFFCWELSFYLIICNHSFFVYVWEDLKACKYIWSVPLRENYHLSLLHMMVTSFFWGWLHHGHLWNTRIRIP